MSRKKNILIQFNVYGCFTFFVKLFYLHDKLSVAHLIFIFDTGTAYALHRDIVIIYQTYMVMIEKEKG